MKTELRIIIALLALIVLYLYVPVLFMFGGMFIDNLIIVMAIISFAVVAGLWYTRKTKEIKNV